MAISRKELNPQDVELEPSGKVLFERLFKRMNDVRRYYGKSMMVSSGVRSYLRQMQIDKQAGRTPTYGSLHLKGAACDIYDASGDLTRWVLSNYTLLKQIGVWIEDVNYTPTWVHFQVLPPKSRRRMFQPYEGPPPEGARKWTLPAEFTAREEEKA